VVSRLLYELPNFEYIAAQSIKDTVYLLHQYGEKARVIAGGTDLLGMMKDRVEGPEFKIPEVLINIKNIPEMNRIEYDEKVGLRIGAAVKLNRLGTSDVIQKKFQVLAQAAGQVGTTQIRNMGTIGGNLCQRPRCLYFRNPHFACGKKGGAICYALKGEHRFHSSIMKYGKCVMAHPSDIAPALVALEAKAIIASCGGTKEVALREFFLGSNRSAENILTSDEILTEIQVPSQNDRTYQVFLKHRIRHAADFSLASVAAAAQILDGICEDVGIVLGGIAPFPYKAYRAEEKLRGKRLDESLIAQAAEALTEEARPLPMNRFKVNLARELVRRALSSIWREAMSASGEAG
jgi:xanthine dehydrogenase YagS FAD-binding subunit